MANDKNKVVENYCLEEMKQLYPNETQIWSVRHKILKKMCTLKRVKYRSNAGSNEPSKQQSPPQPLDQYQKLTIPDLANLLKRLNAQFAPKCYKMIKTSNNVYVVYQQFPFQTLEQYLANQPLNAQQRNHLLQNLAKTVMQAHSKETVILGLNLYNIYLRDKGQVFFGDWTLSKIIGANDKIILTNWELNSQFIGNEVKQQGIFGVWSDIYSLGKIFKAIQTSSSSESTNSSKKNLNALINKMTNKNYKERPSIKQVLRALANQQQQGSSQVTNSKQTYSDIKITSRLRLKKTHTYQDQSMEQMDKSNLKSVKSVNMLLSQKRLEPTKSNHFQIAVSPKSNTSKVIPRSEVASKSIRKINYLEENLSNTNLSHRNSERSWQGNQQTFKSINKKRNLSFVLIDLAEFVIRTDLNPELSFLLLKYALLISKENLQKWKNQKSNSVEHRVFGQILEKELSAVQHIIFSLIQQLRQLASSNVSLKKQIDLSHIINDKYMKEKIVQFSKEIVINCEKNQVQKIFNAKLIDILFKTYLILKKIQEGSYQKFWEKASNEDYIHLSSQKYLKDQKSLGFRYLKSRIAQILSKK